MIKPSLIKSGGKGNDARVASRYNFKANRIEWIKLFWGRV